MPSFQSCAWKLNFPAAKRSKQRILTKRNIRTDVDFNDNLGIPQLGGRGQDKNTREKTDSWHEQRDCLPHEDRVNYITQAAQSHYYSTQVYQLIRNQPKESLFLC